MTKLIFFKYLIIFLFKNYSTLLLCLLQKLFSPTHTDPTLKKWKSPIDKKNNSPTFFVWVKILFSLSIFNYLVKFKAIIVDSIKVTSKSTITILWISIKLVMKTNELVFRAKMIFVEQLVFAFLKNYFGCEKKKIKNSVNSRGKILHSGFYSRETSLSFESLLKENNFKNN